MQFHKWVTGNFHKNVLAGPGGVSGMAKDRALLIIRKKKKKSCSSHLCSFQELPGAIISLVAAESKNSSYLVAAESKN